MTRENPYRWFVRASWPLLGGAWGAWVGLGGYFQLPHNADSFATLLASGVFVFFALAGLFVGALSGAFIGGFVEWLLRRTGAGIVAALSVATVVNALALWQIGDYIQAKYPGLRAYSEIKPHRSNPPGALNPADKRSVQKPCSAPRPTDPGERASWDAECR